MLDLLERMVLIQSGTANKAGVDRMGRLVREALEGLPLEWTVHRQETVGDHLVCSTPRADRQQAVLITGHMDTVFPADTDFNWFRREDGRVRGPGVIDMKGGLVVTIYAVRALAHAGLLEDLPLILLFNSDEETGSPTSIPLLKELAARSVCGLVTECGGLQGQVVTGRRGKLGLRLDVHGRAGHAAFAGGNKASAILELARLIQELEALNDPEQGVVVNVGRIEGGIGPNSVAGHAMALVDTRYTTAAAGQRLYEQIADLVGQGRVEGTSSELQVTNERPVMAQSSANRQLFQLYREVASGYGLIIEEEFRQGVSDASTLAGEGLPVLDGLGPIGEHDHSDREYMLRESLLQRTCLLTGLLVRLGERFSR